MTLAYRLAFALAMLAAVLAAAALVRPPPATGPDDTIIQNLGVVGARPSAARPVCALADQPPTEDSALAGATASAAAGTQPCISF